MRVRRVWGTCVVLLTAGWFFARGPAWAGYVLTLEDPTHSTSTSGGPQGQYQVGATAGDTSGSAFAKVIQNSGTATAVATGSASWFKRWEWQPAFPGDIPGVWHTEAEASHKGSIKGQVGGCGMMQQPTATAKRLWWMNPLEMTATCATPTFNVDTNSIAFLRQQKYVGAWVIEGTESALAEARASRNAPGNSWGVADAGSTGNIVHEEVTTFDLFQGEPR